MTIPTKPAPGELIKAVHDSDIARVKALLEQGADPDEKDYSDDTPLIYATCEDNIELATLLLDHGANPNLGGLGGITPLMYAAQESLRILRLLIDRNALLDQKANGGADAMDWAEMNIDPGMDAFREKAIKILLEAPERQEQIAAEKAEAEAAMGAHDRAKQRQSILKKLRPGMMVKP